MLEEEIQKIIDNDRTHSQQSAVQKSPNSSQTVIAMAENESGSKIIPCRLHNTDSSSISELTLGNRQTSQSD